MTSFISQIDTILTNLGDAATADEINTALKDYSKRDIQAVLAARASESGTVFNGGTITAPLNVEVPADDEVYLFFLQAPAGYEDGFGEMIQVQNFAGETIVGQNVFGQVTVNGTDPSLLLSKTEYAGICTLKSNFVAFADVAGRVFFQASTLGVMTGVNAAPADGSLVAGQVAMWFDQTNGASKVMFKGKSANGTVVTAEVPMA